MRVVDNIVTSHVARENLVTGSRGAHLKRRIQSVFCNINTGLINYRLLLFRMQLIKLKRRTCKLSNQLHVAKSDIYINKIITSVLH